MDGWIVDGWLDGWMDEWMGYNWGHDWMDKWMYGSLSQSGNHLFVLHSFDILQVCTFFRSFSFIFFTILSSLLP